MAHPGGRPPKLTDEQKLEVYKALEQYIQDNADPTLPGFETENEVALQYNVNDSNLYDWPEFSGLIKRCVRKQEAYLLKQGGAGKYNPTIAIFRLKQPQHGYTDKQERDISVKELPSPLLGMSSVSGNNSHQEASSAQ